MTDKPDPPPPNREFPPVIRVYSGPTPTSGKVPAQCSLLSWAFLPGLRVDRLPGDDE